MRCDNCGWDNPEGAVTCQKCARPLHPSSASVGGSGTIRPSGKTVERRYTVMDTSASGARVETLRACAFCGYPATMFSDNCPSCRKPLNERPEVFKLIPSDKHGESILLSVGTEVEIGGTKYKFSR